MAIMKENRLTAHERFEELCILSASGELTPAETEELDRHLAVCAECSEGLSSYKEFVPAGMAYLASQLAEPVEAEEAIANNRVRKEFADIQNEDAPMVPRLPLFTQRRWIAFAAVAVLAIAFTAVGAYRKGRQIGTNESDAVSNGSLSDQLKSVVAERDQIYLGLQVRSNRIDDLTAEVKDQKAELTLLKNLDRERQAQYESLAAMDAHKTSELGSLSAERDSLAAKLRDGEQRLTSLNTELVSVNEERQRDLFRATSFEAQVRDLSARLKEQDQTVQTQQQFLSSDRDIRELMGARQLYIADVFDVSSDSRKRQPYGRVFYTRGKSLIFYAFDLDHQPGVKNAGAFQLWGKNESRPDNPVSLGVLYVDSEANRRWALRCDDPEQLAAIDAVFVTVEPNAHGNKPTGKPFLYASLRKEPNHP